MEEQRRISILCYINTGCEHARKYTIDNIIFSVLFSIVIILSYFNDIVYFLRTCRVLTKYYRTCLIKT